MLNTLIICRSSHSFPLLSSIIQSNTKIMKAQTERTPGVLQPGSMLSSPPPEVGWKCLGGFTSITDPNSLYRLSTQQQQFSPTTSPRSWSETSSFLTSTAREIFSSGPPASHLDSGRAPSGTTGPAWSRTTSTATPA